MVRVKVSRGRRAVRGDARRFPRKIGPARRERVFVVWLTWLVGPIARVLAVVGALRHQPVVALPGFARAELDVDPIVLILNPLHRHRSSIAALARARARVYHARRMAHTRLSVHARAGGDKKKTRGPPRGINIFACVRACVCARPNAESAKWQQINAKQGGRERERHAGKIRDDETGRERERE